VAQLASQEPDATFARVAPGAWDAAMLAGIIRWKVKPQARRWCRQTHKTTEAVHAVTVSPDGLRLAHAAGSKVVVRNLQTGFVVLQLSGHLDGLTSVSWNNDGTKLASGSMDQTVKLWDPSTGACLSTLDADSSVYSVQFSRRGDIIAAGCKDGTVQIIDVATAQVTRQLRGHSDYVRSVCFSLDGTKIASGSDDTTVLTWDAASGEQLCSLRGHTHFVMSVCFSPDGAKVASGSKDKTVLVWDEASGEQLCSLKVDSPVLSVAYSPDGTKLAAGLGYPSYSVLIFDTQNNEQLYQLNVGSAVDSVHHFTASGPLFVDAGYGGMRSVSFSPSGDLIAAGCGKGKNCFIYFVDAAAGQIKSSAKGHRCVLSVCLSVPDFFYLKAIFLPCAWISLKYV